MNSHPTWQIQDASKIQEYMSCPRSYFFQYVLGLRRKEPNVHLEFGTAVHKAMECLLTPSLEEQKPARFGYTPNNVTEAIFAFNEHYRSVFPEAMDDENAPKNPIGFANMIREYAERWKLVDDFTVKHLEVGGTVLLDEGKTLHFRSDAICERPNGEVFTLEHKTGSVRSLGSTTWSEQWVQKFQVGVYSHVLYCFMPTEKVYGVEINGMAPNIGKECKFFRRPVPKTPRQMEDWYHNAIHWYDSIQNDFARMQTCSENDNTMKCFFKQTEHCTSYFGCPYATLCDAWQNPLQHAEDVPIGFKKEYWNPLEMVEQSKTKVNV